MFNNPRTKTNIYASTGGAEHGLAERDDELGAPEEAEEQVQRGVLLVLRVRERLGRDRHAVVAERQARRELLERLEEPLGVLPRRGGGAAARRALVALLRLQCYRFSVRVRLPTCCLNTTQRCRRRRRGPPRRGATAATAGGDCADATGGSGATGGGGAPAMVMNARRSRIPATAAPQPR